MSSRQKLRQASTGTSHLFSFSSLSQIWFCIIGVLMHEYMENPLYKLPKSSLFSQGPCNLAPNHSFDPLHAHSPPISSLPSLSGLLAVSHAQGSMLRPQSFILQPLSAWITHPQISRRLPPSLPSDHSLNVISSEFPLITSS